MREFIAQFLVKFRPEELEQLRDLAARRGMPVGAFLRLLAAREHRLARKERPEASPPRSGKASTGRECQRCGRDLLATKRSHSLWCSGSCRTLASRERRRAVES